MRSIKIGIAGLGNMGKQHCRVISLLKDIEFSGVYDIDPNKCKEIALSFNVTPFNSYTELLSSVDAVVIAVPTTFHYQYAEEAIKKEKHLFIEKPFVSNMQEAERIMALYRQTNKCIIQVGHIERFNPVMELIDNFVTNSNIISIEAKRLSQTDRNLDVDVVLDLMIHDIDIILNLVKSKLQSITAIGSYLNNNNKSLDIVYTILTFQNGVIANLVANRVSKESLRTISITEKHRVLTANYLTKELQIYTNINSDIQISPFIENSIDTIKVPPTEPLQSELQHFVQSILTKTSPIIGPYEAMNALSVAIKIKESILSGETIYLT
ncbi:MAG: Gfo/Idh/MocA family oxidoreductase [Heyndrickxia sp.]